MSQARLEAWRDRRLQPLAFRLTLTDLDTDAPVTRTYTLADRPAEVWALAVLSDEPADLLLDLLDDDDAAELWELVCDPDEELTASLVHRIGRTMLARATGRPWWEATRLLATVANDWHTFLALARDRRLGDPMTWPVEDLCAWVFHRITAHQSEEDRARFEAELAHPPADVDPDEADYEGETAGEDWLAAYNAIGGGMAGEDGVARG